MDDERLIEIRARAALASAGPWRWEHGYGDMCNERDCPWGALVADADAEVPHIRMDIHGFDVQGFDAADAAFIAHAREDIPWLLAALREIRAHLRAADHCGCKECDEIVAQGLEVARG
jgi:hypothetical protein